MCLSGRWRREEQAGTPNGCLGPKGRQQRVQGDQRKVPYGQEPSDTVRLRVPWWVLGWAGVCVTL